MVISSRLRFFDYSFKRQKKLAKTTSRSKFYNSSYQAQGETLEAGTKRQARRSMEYNLLSLSPLHSNSQQLICRLTNKVPMKQKLGRMYLLTLSFTCKNKSQDQCEGSVTKITCPAVLATCVWSLDLTQVEENQVHTVVPSSIHAMTCIPTPTL